VIAFARVSGAQAVICVVGRHFATAASWPDTQLTLSDDVPSGHYREVLSGRTLTISGAAALDVAELLAPLGTALLERIE
jgi:maltooligosyltrehalose synthase